MADLQIVVAKKCLVEAQYVEMKVPLYSYGCERKIKKALAHLKGIYSIVVDFEEQKVTVWGICNKFDVLASIKNKRKDSCFWKDEDNIELEALESSPELATPKAHRPSPRGLALIKFRARSLGFKSLRKVFLRSQSF